MPKVHEILHTLETKLEFSPTTYLESEDSIDKPAKQETAPNLFLHLKGIVKFSNAVLMNNNLFGNQEENEYLFSLICCSTSPNISSFSIVWMVVCVIVISFIWISK